MKYPAGENDGDGGVLAGHEMVVVVFIFVVIDLVKVKVEVEVNVELNQEVRVIWGRGMIVIGQGE